MLSSLPSSYNNIITALEARADDLTLEFVTARLLHDVSRRTQHKFDKEETALYTRNRHQNDGETSPGSGEKKGVPGISGIGPVFTVERSDISKMCAGKDLRICNSPKRGK